VSTPSCVNTPTLSINSPAASRVGTPALSIISPAASRAGKGVSAASCMDVKDAEDPIVKDAEDSIVEDTEDLIVEDTEDPIVEDAEDPIIEDTEDPIVEDAEDPIVEDTEDLFVEDSDIANPLAGAGSADEDLQGALHTTGGIFHGRTVSNVYNMGDAWEMQGTEVASGPVIGRVLLYDS
jgi:hypothetical protein